MFSADLLERFVKTGAQAFIVAFAGSVVASVTPGITWSVAWWQSLGIAAAAAGATALMSAFTSLLSKPFGNPNTASLLPAVAPAPVLVAAAAETRSTAETHAAVYPPSGPPVVEYADELPPAA
jgi:hypothetical protein